MNKGKRILLLGTTGMDKKDAVARLAAAGTSVWRRRSQKTIRFEHEYLNPLIPHHAFLSKAYRDQKELWRKAWANLRADLSGLDDEDIILDMHGCIVSGRYGVRVLMDLQSVIDDFKPEVIVTLIDNVYDQWWKTEERARIVEVFRLPTLEQLLTARRVEIVVGDQLAHLPPAPIRHYVLAMSHSTDTLARLVYSPAYVVYLCFPISAPRRQLPDTSGITAVNNFIARAYAIQSEDAHGNLVFTCPLTIDELPLRKAYLSAKNAYMREHLVSVPAQENTSNPLASISPNSEAIEDAHGELEEQFLENVSIEFVPEEKRWDVSQLWGESLGNGSPIIEKRKQIPATQLKAAAGIIFTDITWRDYHLVSQADCVLSFNPCFLGKEIARSVKSEIRSAAKDEKPVVVYQDPSRDPEGLVQKEFGRGTMAPDSIAELVTLPNDLDDAYAIVCELAKRA